MIIIMSHYMYILAADTGQPSFPVFPETSYASEELFTVHDKSDSHEADQSDVKFDIWFTTRSVFWRLYDVLRISR